MLVRLIDLPGIETLEADLSKKGIIFRRPIAPEKELLVRWVRTNFSDYWGSEMDVAFSHQPVTCFIAQSGHQPIGFACYETTAKNFFGPTGVVPTYQGLGIGKVLLVKALEALRELGYAYARHRRCGPGRLLSKKQ